MLTLNRIYFWFRRDLRLHDHAALARALATLDALCALTERSLTLHWCAPQFMREPGIEIRAGRHPVVEAALMRSSGGTGFVPNDCDLGRECRLWLLTGPNMAGKSTYLRQNALITILAQMGSFVPATSAHIGTVDRLFSRVGAADDLARGRSTFMVEMTEAATTPVVAARRPAVTSSESPGRKKPTRRPVSAKMITNRMP